MKFLAGDDIEYYIHSKLSQNCKEKKLDSESVRELVADKIVEALSEDDKVRNLFTDEELEAFEEKLSDKPNFQDIREYIDEVFIAFDTDSKAYDFINSLSNFVNTIHYLYNPDEAHVTINNCSVIDFGDISEYSFTTISDNLLNTLYLINEAAKNIEATKSNFLKELESFQQDIEQVLNLQINTIDARNIVDKMKQVQKIIKATCTGVTEKKISYEVLFKSLLEYKHTVLNSIKCLFADTKEFQCSLKLESANNDLANNIVLLDKALEYLNVELGAEDYPLRDAELLLENLENLTQSIDGFISYVYPLVFRKENMRTLTNKSN